ncbi:lysozyme [Cereibacter sp. SYSU M97828]|nr:lysozyme [Cereibacter flavus]
MSINKAALDLIKEFEGFEPMAYHDPVGILTIGYGTTAAADVGIIPREGMVISEAQATEYLRRAVDKFAAQIRPRITMPVNANQFGAMVSLAYNIGPGAFNTSTLLRKFNAGDTAGVAEQFLVWDKAGGRIMRGLHAAVRPSASCF